MTQEEFNEMFVVAMNTYGRAVENDSDVPVVPASELTDEDSTIYSMPVVKNQNGLMSYAKVDIEDFMEGVASKVGSEGMLQSITEAEFNEIFYPSSSSSD